MGISVETGAGDRWVTGAAMVLRPPRIDEHRQWAALFTAYREFYGLDPDGTVIERVWAWIHDPTHEVNALVAVCGDSNIVGLAHHRRFARPSGGTTGVYLDDLMVHPDHRGTGIGRGMVEGLSAIAHREGASVVRWVTAADNATARSLYDALAEPTTWVTYDISLR